MNKSKEQICFFNTHKAWGGGEKWHSEAACFFQEKGFHVLVCGNENGELLKKIPGEIETASVRYSNLSFLNPFAYFRTYKILRNRNIHSIILCLPIDIKIAGVVAKFCKIPHIIYRRGSAIPIKNSWSNRFLFSHIVTDIIANSEATKTTILQNNTNLFDSSRIKVLYNGIAIPPCSGKTENQVVTIGFAGRLEPQKNLFSLIAVADILKKKNLSFLIKIAGDGSLREQLEQEVHTRNLEDCVKFVGFQSNMNEFYSSLDLFVLPSLWEGFGYVLAEAMTYKLPLVAYNVSSNPELIIDGKNGFLVPLGDENLFAEKIAEMIANPSLRCEMGECARRFVEEHFDKNRNLQKVEEFICNL
ncbi:MAG: glycosyltransferase [Bacteroidales bacterium]|nr:glycosyltransferase [Bacteroidales bacterium]